MHAKLQTRPARPDDAPRILNLLNQLAAFEGEPGGVALDEATLRRDAFGSHPRIEVLLAELDGTVRGMTILYQAYSSWRGAATLMIHDLFIEEEARGSGAGKALVTAAAKLAAERGACRLDVNVLNWNEKARRFYESLGFNALTDWMPHRLDREAMLKLAKDES
ncbi:MAG TPA: GNAT family N-acetyltransferase [Candidatus Sulfotelmatobacter sp.]|jgi:GNAT superfamily N-acetyltransferase|nr:GNAT family N-acetyltransferase [Candidatus Sulfotelmatobacter sp.]